MRRAVEEAADATAGPNGPALATSSQAPPEFDQRNYGYAKLSDLIKATKLFELQARLVGEGPGKRYYLRDKRDAEG